MQFAESKLSSFLPSEVARLVYGYLENEGCVHAAQMFLETSNDLTECLAVAQKGKAFSTKIVGYNLLQLLDLISDVADQVRMLANVHQWESPGSTHIKKLTSLLKIEEVNPPSEPSPINFSNQLPLMNHTPLNTCVAGPAQPRIGNLFVNSMLMPPLERPGIPQVNGIPYSVVSIDNQGVPVGVSPNRIVAIDQFPNIVKEGTDFSDTIVTPNEPACKCKCKCKHTKISEPIKATDVQSVVVRPENKAVSCYKKPRMRPIAPKLVDHLEGGVTIQAIHTKQSPLVDLALSIPKRPRLSKKQSAKKK